jgi:tellurite resistance-related uncharacterized protein
MKTLPDNVVPYKRTPEFNEDNIPNGLLNSHQTKDGVWAKIVVLEGRLQYSIDGAGNEGSILDKNVHGVVEPTVIHQVKPLGKVKFYVEFYRQAAS